MHDDIERRYSSRARSRAQLLSGVEFDGKNTTMPWKLKKEDCRTISNLLSANYQLIINYLFFVDKAFFSIN
jgi:hypothetical protein